MNKKPRIAFCFSWQARTLDQTYIFFQKNLFDAAKEQGFDYDVFCAVEDDEDVDKVNLLKPTKVEKIKSDDVDKIIKKKWGANRKKILFWNYRYPPASPKSYSNLMQQLFKISQSIKLSKKNDEHYDIIFRLRYDFIFFNKLNFNRIVWSIKNWSILCNKESVLIRHEFIKKRLLIINDFFFIWNQESMSLFECIFDNIEISLKWDEKNNIVEKCFSFLEWIVIYLNKILKHWIFPVVPFYYIETYFHKVFSAESCFYYYFKKQNINLILEEFSYILLKSHPKESFITIVDKNDFEL